MSDQSYSIFVSHAAVDEEIAASVKQFIERALPAHKVFVSSDPGDLKPGDEWVAKILSALETASCILALTTERGLSRKWVWFETGRAWFTKVRLIPCCIGKVRKSGLPAPFSERQAINIDEESGVETLFGALREQFGSLAQPPDYAEFARTLIRLDVRAEERIKISQDPFVSQIMSDIERTMKMLTPAQRETIKQFAIYGELSTAGARLRVKETGVNMDQWSVPSHLITLTGWLISNTGNSTYDEMQQNVYSINPVVKPHLRAYFSKQE